jgi:hypothetical protein
MNLQAWLLAVVVSIGLSMSVVGQEGRRYVVPRTEYGHPDFRGVWGTAFLTQLERPQGVDYLAATPEQAAALVEAIRSRRPAVVDPDFDLHDIRELAKVKGQYRTSVIVDPPDGRMPFTQVGLDLAASVGARNAKNFDGPEVRPLAERCLENLGYAPIRTVPVFLPRLIVQTRDHVLLFSEDAVGLRIIHLKALPRRDSLRSIEGYSAGRWEGDTLVVQTTHLRADDPARTVIGRPLLISARTQIQERFTRVSDDELYYQFTVEDDQLYTRPWTGEFSLTRHDWADL